MKYVGVCYDSGGWGGDLTGVLVAQDSDGWKTAGFHISSSESFSKVDIQRRYDQRAAPSSDDTYEWLGRMELHAIEEHFGWAASPSEETR